MAEESPLMAAIRQLQQSLATLQDAVEHREEERKRRANLEEELHRVGADRSQLAHALDSAEARGARLEEANREVARRLVSAMETVRTVLARQRGAA
ncbi:MAG: DUF4164 domain-containing protein [Bauldia sp.]|nr:DUF4164 domain-containing protein [Bauldia sp.]